MSIADYTNEIINLVKMLPMNGNCKIYRENLNSLSDDEQVLLKKMKLTFQMDTHLMKIKRETITKKQRPTRNALETNPPQEPQQEAMNSHQAEAEQPHQCFDISHDTDLPFDEAPVNDSSYDKTDKFLTLKSKIPDSLYERLIKLTKLMDDTYNKLQMNPTDSYLEAHYDNIVKKHRDLMSSVYSSYHDYLLQPDTIITKYDDELEKDLCRVLERPYVRLIKKPKRKRKYRAR